MMRRGVAMDVASQHRAAGTFALAFAAAAISALAGVFAIDAGALRLAAVFPLELLPDASWMATWLNGAVTAAEQQQAAAQQWLRIVLLFGALAATIACINALIGFASHANERRYETALRGMVGAAPTQLRRRLMRGAVLNALAGATLGIGVGSAVALLLLRMWRADAGIDAGWPVFALALCFAVAAFAARTAARRFNRRGWLGDALAPEARTVPGFGAEDLRALLTGAQLACAVALTIVSGLVWSYASARSLAPDAAEDRWVASVTAGPNTTAQDIRAQLRAAGMAAESIATPGALLGIGKVDKVISMCGNCSRANMYTPLFALETQQHVVGTGFFRVAGIVIERGREFHERANDARSVVINQAFAQQAFMQQTPIGKQIMVGGGERGAWYVVVGVVADVPTTGLHHLTADPAALPGAAPKAAAAIYFEATTHPPAQFDVIVKSTTPVALAGLSFEPLTRLFARASEPQRNFARVLSLLGLLLCGAATIGTFTTAMLSVGARRIEIAIRRSVGARRIDVERLVIGRVASIALKGAAAGVIISVGLARALEGFVPGLPAFNGRTTLLVVIAFLVTALLASLLPLRAALRISPAGTRD